MGTHKAKNLIVTFIVVLAAFMFVTAARAGDPAQTQGADPKITLKGYFLRKAGGEAVIKDAGPGQKEISITAHGLKPNAVYTVWLVNMKPKMDMMGLGQAMDYAFKSDDKGNGTYTGTIAAEDLAKWQMIEIAYHPTGDAKDMKKMKVAMKGGLMKMMK